MEKSISGSFDKAAIRKRSYFQDSLTRKFGPDSIAEVERVFDNLDLPVPTSFNSYYEGRTGVLVFLERYATVMRIEFKDGMTDPDGRKIERVDDNALIARPFASINLDTCTIELCPGFKKGGTWDDAAVLRQELIKDGIDCYDAHPENLGLSPITGRIMLIDRLSVTRLSNSVAPIKEALENAEKIAYRQLTDALDNAWPDKSENADPIKMKNFWQVCRDFKDQGKMVASWTTGKSDATGASRVYEYMIEDHESKKLPGILQTVVKTYRTLTRKY